MKNPFDSDYAGAPLTQAAVATTAACKPVEVTTAAPAKLADAAGDQRIEMTPIPTVSGKPRRLIIRGKVTCG